MADFDSYLRYKRPPGFKFEFPADKKFVWIQQGKGQERSYTVAEVLETKDEQYRIRIKDTTEERWVDITETEGVNPAKFDGVEDCAMLGHLSQASVLHNLRLRFDANIIYTYSGLFLVSVNPYNWFPIYTQEVIKRYINRRRTDVPPHVYAVADEAYRKLLKERGCQSMLVTGESGAGKTENTKKIIQYLATIAGRGGEGSLEEKIIQANPLLEALGNAKTLKNNNSSRFGKFIKITFDNGGIISGSSIDSYLLERSRVVKRGIDERSFHIFYQLIAALSPQEKSQYHLTTFSDYNYLSSSGAYTADGIDDVQEFAATKYALNVLGFSATEQDMLFRVIAAILHIGNVKFTGDEESKIVSETPIEIASKLLGVEPKTLKNALIYPRIQVGRELIAKHLNPWQAERSRDALSKAIYGRLFLWALDKINFTLKVQQKDLFIGILDIAGFEIFPYNSFEQMCINFTNERLQQFFNNHMFHLEQEEYRREKIEWTFVNFGIDSQATIDLIQKKPRGIMVILDEETVFPKATDTSFVEKLEKNQGNPKFKREVTDKPTVFSIDHYAGRVEYDATLWLEKNKDPLQDDLQLCLKNSSDPLISYFWSNFGSTMKGGASFATVGAMYRLQLDSLMNTLGATYPHFVRCIIPNHKKQRAFLDFPIVLDQLACNGVLEGIKISRLGFPNRMTYGEFLKRYYLLVKGISSKSPDAKDATKKIIDKLLADQVIDNERVRFGVTKIFFRTGEMAKVEELREKIVGEIIIEIQAAARGYIGRKVYERFCQRQTAVLVIQNAIRVYLAVKDNGWFLLMKRVRAPEFQLKHQREKIERELKEKIQKLVDEIEQIHQEKKLLNQQIEQINSALETDQLELQSKRERYSKLQDSIAEVYDDCKLIDKEIAEKNNELASKDRDLKSGRDTSVSLQLDAKLLEQKINEVHNDCLKITEMINLSRADILRTQTKVDEQKDAVKAQQFSEKNISSQIESQQEIVRQKIEQKTGIIKEKLDTDNQFHITLQKKKEQETEIAKTEKVIENLSTEIRNTKPVLDQTAKRRKETQQTTQQLENEKSVTEGKFQETELAASRLNTDNKNLTTDLGRVNLNLEAERKVTKDLSDKITRISEELAEESTKLNLIQESKNTKQFTKTVCEKKIQELQNLLKDATIKFEKLTKELFNLTEESNQTTAEVEKTNSDKSKIEKNIQKLEAEHAELSEKVKESQGNNSRLLKQKEKIDLKSIEIQKQISEEKQRKTKIEAQSQKLKEEKENLQNELTSTGQELSTLNQNHVQLQSKLDQLENSLLQTTSAHNTTVKKLQTTTKQKDQLHAQKDELTNEKQSLHKRIEQLHEQQTTFSVKLEEAREVKKRHLARQKQLESEVEALHEKNLSLNKANESAERASAGLEKEFQRILSELHSTEDKSQDETKNSNSLESQLLESQREFSQISQKITKTQSSIKQIQDQIDEKKFKMEQTTTSNSEVEGQNRALNDKIYDLQAKMDEMKNLKTKTKNLISQLIEDIHEQNIKNSEASSQAMADELKEKYRNDIRTTREDLQQQMDAKEKLSLQLRSLQTQAEIVEKEIRTTKTDLENADHDKKNLLHKIQMVSKEYTSVKTENEQLEHKVNSLEKKLARFLSAHEVKTKQKSTKKKPTEKAKKKPSQAPVSDQSPVDTESQPPVSQEHETDVPADSKPDHPEPEPPVSISSDEEDHPVPDATEEAAISKEEQLRNYRDQIRRLTNDIKNERRQAEYFEKHWETLEFEAGKLRQQIVDTAKTNSNSRHQTDHLEEDVDILKGSLLADQEIMDLMNKLLAEKSLEIDHAKDSLAKIQSERDTAQNHHTKISKDLLVLKSDLDRERQLAVTARNLMSKNNSRLINAQTESRIDRLGAEDSPIPIPHNRSTPQELRRETIRIIKVIKKLRAQLVTSTQEKETQEKITWQLIDEVDKLRRAVSELTSARIIAQKEHQAIQKQVSSAEDFAKDLQFKRDLALHLSHDLQREIDTSRDRLSTYSEQNSQLEKSKEKYEKLVRDLNRQIEFAQQRKSIISEEKSEEEFHNKKLKRQLLEESYANRTATEDFNRYEEKLQNARQELASKHHEFTQQERDREALHQDLYQTVTHLDQLQTIDLAEPEKLRLEKQVFGFKNSITEEKARVNLIRKKTLEIEDDMEKVRFDIKTLKQDLIRTKMAVQRTKKANQEIRALKEKRIDSDEEEKQLRDEEDLLLSSDEEEMKKKRRQRHKPTKTKRNERRVF